jgi:hypothetical protein
MPNLDRVFRWDKGLTQVQGAETWLPAKCCITLE